MWADFARTGHPGEKYNKINPHLSHLNSPLEFSVDLIWPAYSPSRSPLKLFIESGGNVFVEDMRTARTELQKRRIQFWIGERFLLKRFLNITKQGQLTLQGEIYLLQGNFLALSR